ncbi:hypothetical protein EMGBS1_06410 [Chloroflexota bacterium]|nr:hypothetical protein EMGBS1_06410 [Chloroflexota bacterium]
MDCALLIIDVQQALCSGKLEVFEAARVIDTVNLVAAKARAARALLYSFSTRLMTGCLFTARPDGDLLMAWLLAWAICEFVSAVPILFTTLS